MNSSSSILFMFRNVSPSICDAQLSRRLSATTSAILVMSCTATTSFLGEHHIPLIKTTSCFLVQVVNSSKQFGCNFLTFVCFHLISYFILYTPYSRKRADCMYVICEQTNPLIIMKVNCKHTVCKSTVHCYCTPCMRTNTHVHYTSKNSV